MRRLLAAYHVVAAVVSGLILAIVVLLLPSADEIEDRVSGVMIGIFSALVIASSSFIAASLAGRIVSRPLTILLAAMVLLGLAIVMTALAIGGSWPIDGWALTLTHVALTVWSLQHVRR